MLFLVSNDKPERTRICGRGECEFDFADSHNRRVAHGEQAITKRIGNGLILEPEAMRAC